MGSSRRTSVAGLSSRNPLYDGARSRPSCVHSANSTSQTSSGSTQMTSLFRTFGIFGTSRNGEVGRLSGRNLSSSLSISRAFALHVPRVNALGHDPLEPLIGGRAEERFAVVERL